ncbi:MAG: PadR family transcriptional regulator [Allosphingosinicella sp.]
MHGFGDRVDPWASVTEFADSDLHQRGAWAGRSRRARIFGPGELRLALLRLLADSPGHGYELIKTIEGMTGGEYSPSAGSVYPTLQLLVDEDAITERRDDDGTRKTYAVAAQGKRELAEREAEASALMDRLAGLAEERRPASVLQVNRAIQNLRNAVRVQSHRGALHGEALNAILDVIDEAARRIERM